MVQLSDYLNELLDFDGGEDFAKLADAPRTAPDVAPDDEDGSGLCKTDRKALCRHIEWMCRYLQNEKEAGRLTTVGENKIRLLKRLLEKLASPAT